jgi:hypothetical protein
MRLVSDRSTAPSFLISGLQDLGAVERLACRVSLPPLAESYSRPAVTNDLLTKSGLISTYANKKSSAVSVFAELS